MLNLNEVEQKVLSFWADDHTFERSVASRRGCQPFVIYEGPPTANGKPGIHHVLTRTFKDMLARFQTMNGRLVERKAGWDEHGLPVEIEVQKELGLHTKAAVEKFGVKNFNDKCAVSVQKYVGDWEALTRRMGYWLDFNNAYRTSDPKYIRKVWVILRQLFESGLIYKASKVVPWACDSGTVVSNAEVAQGYKVVKHLSANVLFQLCDDTNYIMAWTTTPWTLPGNMALAVNPKLTYKLCQVRNKRIFSLKEIGEVLAEVPGERLVGQEYYHPFNHKVLPVVAADFVKNEATGVVHIAPAFGQDDYKLWQEQLNYTPIVCHVDPDGKFNDPDWLKGQNVLADNFRTANGQVLDFLRADEKIFSVEEYEHEYPHNWRTGKPLIYYLRPSWYVNVNAFRAKMIEANEYVAWFPKHIKHGRFGDWLKGEVDWSISRERFWGTPLPFYCEDGQDEHQVIYPASEHKPLADEEYARLTYDYKFHKRITRTPEVLDCWFDSGAMPFAAFDEYQQADVICEAIDQTRGWFYSLLAIGTALKGQAPYKRVVCLGHILDKDGNKMAKTKGNVVDPWKMFEKYGADVVRWYMVSNPVGNSITFKEDELRGIVQNFVNRLWNCYTFYEMYAKIEKPDMAFPWALKAKVEQQIDQWILARLTMMVNCTGIFYDQTYEFAEVCSEVENFVNDLSNIWIRANRSRFWNTEGKGTDQVAFYVLHTCLTELCKVIAPIMPFLSEHMWRLLNPGSVHMQDYPKGRNLTWDENVLVEQMEKAQKIVTAGHHLRDVAKIKVRQALPAVVVPKEIQDVCFEKYVLEELNVKELRYHDYHEGPITLDTTLTEELIAEGLARDFIRVVQNLRKEAGLQVTDRICLTVNCRGDEQIETRLAPHQEEIMKKLLAVEWLDEEECPDFKVGDCTMGIALKKISWPLL